MSFVLPHNLIDYRALERYCSVVHKNVICACNIFLYYYAFLLLYFFIHFFLAERRNVGEKNCLLKDFRFSVDNNIIKHQSSNLSSFRWGSDITNLISGKSSGIRSFMEFLGVCCGVLWAFESGRNNVNIMKCPKFNKNQWEPVRYKSNTFT